MFGKLIAITCTVLISWSQADDSNKKYAISFASVNIQKNLDSSGLPVVNSTIDEEDSSYNYINYHVYTPIKKQPVLNYNPGSIEKFNKTFLDHLEQLNGQLNNQLQYSKHEYEASEEKESIKNNAQSKPVYYQQNNRGRAVVESDASNGDANYYSNDEYQPRQKLAAAPKDSPRKQLREKTKTYNTDTTSYNNKYNSHIEADDLINSAKTYADTTSYGNKYSHHGQQVDDLINNVQEVQQHTDYNTINQARDNRFKQQSTRTKESKDITHRDQDDNNALEATNVKSVDHRQPRPQPIIKYKQEPVYRGNERFKQPYIYKQQPSADYSELYRQRDANLVVSTQTNKQQSYVITESTNINNNNDYDAVLHENIYYNKHKAAKQIPTKQQQDGQQQEFHSTSSKPTNVYVNDHISDGQDIYYKANSGDNNRQTPFAQSFHDGYPTYYKLKGNNNDTLVTKQAVDKQKAYLTPSKYDDYSTYMQQPIESVHNNKQKSNKQVDNKHQYLASTAKYIDDYYRNEQPVEFKKIQQHDKPYKGEKQSFVVKQQQQLPESVSQLYLTSTVKYNNDYSTYEQSLTSKLTNNEQPIYEQPAVVYSKPKPNRRPVKLQTDGEQPIYMSSTVKYASNDDFAANEQRATVAAKLKNNDYSAYEQQPVELKNVYKPVGNNKQADNMMYISSSTPKYIDDYFGNEQRATSAKYNNNNDYSAYEQQQSVEPKHVYNKAKYYNKEQPERQQIYVASTAKYADEFNMHEQLFNKSRHEKESIVIKQLSSDDRPQLIISSTPKYPIHMSTAKYNEDYFTEQKHNAYNNKPKKIKPAPKQIDNGKQQLLYSPSSSTAKYNNENYYGNEHVTPMKLYNDHIVYEEQKIKNIDQPFMKQSDNKQYHLPSTAKYNENYFGNDHFGTASKLIDDYSTYDLLNAYNNPRKNNNEHIAQEQDDDNNKKSLYSASTAKYNEDHFVGNEISKHNRDHSVAHERPVEQINVGNKPRINKDSTKQQLYLTTTAKYSDDYFATGQSTTMSNIKHDFSTYDQAVEPKNVYNAPKRIKDLDVKHTDGKQQYLVSTAKYNEDYFGNNEQDNMFYKPTHNNLKDLFIKQTRTKPEYYSTPTSVVNGSYYHENQELANAYNKAEGNVIEQQGGNNRQHNYYNNIVNGLPKQASLKQTDSSSSKQPKYYDYHHPNKQQQLDETESIYQKHNLKNNENNNSYHMPKHPLIQENIYYKPQLVAKHVIAKQPPPAKSNSYQPQDDHSMLDYETKGNDYQQHAYYNKPKLNDNYQIPDHQVYRNNKAVNTKNVLKQQGGNGDNHAFTAEPSAYNNYDYKLSDDELVQANKLNDNFNAHSKSFSYQPVDPKTGKYLNDYKTPFGYNEKDKQQTDRDRFYSDIGDDSFFQ